MVVGWVNLVVGLSWPWEFGVYTNMLLLFVSHFALVGLMPGVGRASTLMISDVSK